MRSRWRFDVVIYTRMSFISLGSVRFYVRDNLYGCILLLNKLGLDFAQRKLIFINMI